MEGLHHSGHRSPRTSWRKLQRKRSCCLSCFCTILTRMNCCCKFFKWLIFHGNSRKTGPEKQQRKCVTCSFLPLRMNVAWMRHESGTLTPSYINYIIKCSCHNILCNVGSYCLVKIDFSSLHKVNTQSFVFALTTFGMLLTLFFQTSDTCLNGGEENSAELVKRPPRMKYLSQWHWLRSDSCPQLNDSYNINFPSSRL